MTELENNPTLLNGRYKITSILNQTARSRTLAALDLSQATEVIIKELRFHHIDRSNIVCEH